MLSANGRKVQAVCLELDIDATIEEVNVYAGEGQNREYLDINPLGQIPALIDDHITLCESNAILVYLSEQYRDMHLYGSTPDQRAKVNKWLFWESSQWQPVLTSILGPSIGHKLLPDIFPAPQSGPNWESEEIVKQLGYLENNLHGTWLTDHELSIADYSVAAMATYFVVCEFPFIYYPNISAWLERLSERDAWLKTEHPLWRNARISDQHLI